MSAIAGVFSRCGLAVREDQVRSLARALRRLGPDGHRVTCRGPVGMVHSAFGVDHESRLRADPLVTDDGYILSVNGRVDNVGDIECRLPRRSRHRAGRSQLILEAYRKWGVASFGMLIGDFAFALWDPRQECLLLCCDSLGRYSLYYHCDRDRVTWCSLAWPLVTDVPLHLEFDEEYIADFLAHRVSDHGPYKGVNVVLGGHVVLVDKATAKDMRYWSFDATRSVRYQSDADYEEHFREVFREAVACRLQTDAPVFCQLSGGVDSSSIACVANDLVRSGAVEAPELETVSFVFADSVSADESDFIATVERHLGKPGGRISERDCTILSPLPESFAGDTPTNRLWFISHDDHLARIMRTRGSRVLLSGIGGDQLFWSQYYPGMPVANLLASGRLFDALRCSLEWARAAHSSIFEVLWFGGCWPLLPRRWQGRVRWEGAFGEWFAPSFVRRMNLIERSLPMPDDVGFRLPTARMQYGCIRRTMRPHALDLCLSEDYIEVRYPYLDRRLVEFALAIPLEQMVRPTESRSIVRRALRGLVPDAVLDRRNKTSWGEVLFRTLAKQWPVVSDILTASRLGEMGIVDQPAFTRALDRARHGFATNLVQLMWTISLELWIRHVDSRLHREETPCRPAGGELVCSGGSHARTPAAVPPA